MVVVEPVGAFCHRFVLTEELLALPKFISTF